MDEKPVTVEETLQLLSNLKRFFVGYPPYTKTVEDLLDRASRVGVERGSSVVVKTAEKLTLEDLRMMLTLDDLRELAHLFGYRIIVLRRKSR